MRTIVQISLDLITIPEALETAALALRSGVDWLEAGTPLIIAEGVNGVRTLRTEFPQIPIVADLKTMDGGWLEAEMMAKAGATHVVVMERAHRETIKMVVRAGRDFGIEVMGDNLAAPDPVSFSTSNGTPGGFRGPSCPRLAGCLRGVRQNHRLCRGTFPCRQGL